MRPRITLLTLAVFLLPCVSWAYTVPSEFALVRSAPGTRLYQTPPPPATGSRFVQVVQVDQGARARLPHGAVSQTGDLCYRPLFKRPLSAFWNDLNDSPLAFSISNAGFFGPGDPGGVALPLKVDGNLIACGYANGCWVGVLKILKIWDYRFRIDDFDGDPNVVIISTAPNIIGGLSENANCPTSTAGNCAGEACKGGSTRRTFVGCADNLGAGDYRTLLILTTRSAITGPDAGAILRSFGAGPTMMLDGGGSTQMMCQGQLYVESSDEPNPREINTTIGVLAADVTPPTTPMNLTASPSSCTPDNSFSFSWNPSSDPETGIQEYRWKVNTGAEQPTTATTVGPQAFSPVHDGTNTFYVRAINGQGLSSGTASVNFCWLPVGSPNLSFEDDVAPPDGIPDGWTLGGTGFDYPPPCPVPGLPCAAEGIRYIRFAHSISSEWSAIGQRATEPTRPLILPDMWYRVSFWYRTGSTAPFGWRLGDSGLVNHSSDALLGAMVVRPLVDGQWHHFWGAPFRITQDDLNQYPMLAFYYDAGSIGAVDVDWVVIEPSAPCSP